MLRLETTDELAADALWSLGAVAVTETGDGLEAGFSSPDAERAAAEALRDRWTAVVVDVNDAWWADAWRTHVRPVTVAGVTIRPAWLPGPGIVIEPGRAFGIGSHPTTRLAIDALAGVVTHGDTLLDVGTGTGVLAIVATELGAARCVAIDTDEHAVAVAMANIERNGCASRIAATSTPLADVAGMFDVVVANVGGLRAPIALAGDLARRARRTVIVSGLLTPAAGGPPDTLLDQAFAPSGFARRRTLTADGWGAVVYERAPASSIRQSTNVSGHTAPISDPNKDPKKETRAG